MNRHILKLIFDCQISVKRSIGLLSIKNPYLFSYSRGFVGTGFFVPKRDKQTSEIFFDESIKLTNKSIAQALNELDGRKELSHSSSPKTRQVVGKNKKLKNKRYNLSLWPAFRVKGYATAECYDLDTLRQAILDMKAYQIYDPIDNEIPDDCLCVKAKYTMPDETEPRNVFFFEDGTVVFWNISQEEERTIHSMLLRHSENPYPIQMVNEESEMFTYSRIVENVDHETDDDNNKQLEKKQQHQKVQNSNVTRLLKSHIYFSSSSVEKTNVLEKYAFADAIALSVKLGIWEKELEKFAENIEYLTDDLKQGRKLKLTYSDILKKLGELFTMRHMVNLYSNILDTPDFYWDREHLEQLYNSSTSNLNVLKRTRVFNDKLDHCIQLMEILKQNQTDVKHTRLEWIIIYLIAIEVAIALGLLGFLKSLVLDIFK